MGNRSRCTPSRDTSGPRPPASRPATLSSSSMKMMPSCSARRTASLVSRSMSMSLAASSSVKASSASGMVRRRRLVRLDCGNMDCRLRTISSMPVPENTSMNDWGVSLVSISTDLSLSLPSCRSRRRFSRVLVSAAGAAGTSGAGGAPASDPRGVRPGRAGGSSTSSRRSSAFSRARGRRRSRSSSRNIDTAVSARSRTMESTSRPT